MNLEIKMSERKLLTQQEIKTVKIYLNKMKDFTENELGYREKMRDWTDEELARITSNIRLIDMFGDGDPIKAAQNHRRLWLDKWTKEIFALINT